MNKKSLFVVLISALTIMVSLTYQGTYSYFTSSVEGTGNIENNTSTTNTEELSDLIITNGENISNTTMIPGDSVTITFSVQNPNDIKVCFDLLWNNTTNEFVNQQDLVYSLKDEDTNVLVTEKTYPKTNVGTTLLIDGTSIEANETKTYTLTITYKETDKDQTADIGKTFNSSIIGELGECYVPPIATEYIASLATTNDEIVNDNTVDENLRYIGANPNNYVQFNNELWRIIGVFNNIDDGTGNKETRLKIIRNELYNTNIAWDTGGVNDWTRASLQEKLNGTYLESITSPSKEMIGNTKWNLGGSSTNNDVTASMFYERERGTTVYSKHQIEWTGKIGLMYPSDYGYATSGGSTTNREACLDIDLYHWYYSSSNNYPDCYNNDWLYDSSNTQWTLTPRASFSYYVFIVNSYGSLRSSSTYISYGVSPALYLNSNVKIVSGEGTESNPFVLSL